MAGNMTGGLLSQKLQQLVQSTDFKWTYAIFWQLFRYDEKANPSLGWADGCFKGSGEPEADENGDISGWVENQQLRQRLLKDLHKLNQSNDEDATAAAKELHNVTYTEWFYIVSMSCSFQSGDGTPGQALANGDYAWLMGANQVSDNECTRAKLAQMAGMQTIVCVLTSAGVVELGSTDLIFENRDLVQNVRALFEKGSDQASTYGASQDEDWTNRNSSGYGGRQQGGYYDGSQRYGGRQHGGYYDGSQRYGGLQQGGYYDGSQRLSPYDQMYYNRIAMQKAMQNNQAMGEAMRQIGADAMDIMR